MLPHPATFGLNSWCVPVQQLHCGTRLLGCGSKRRKQAVSKGRPQWCSASSFIDKLCSAATIMEKKVPFPCFNQKFQKLQNGGKWYRNLLEKILEILRIAELPKCKPFNQKFWKFLGDKSHWMLLYLLTINFLYITISITKKNYTSTDIPVT